MSISENLRQLTEVQLLVVCRGVYPIFRHPFTSALTFLKGLKSVITHPAETGRMALFWFVSTLPVTVEAMFDDGSLYPAEDRPEGLVVPITTVGESDLLQAMTTASREGGKKGGRDGLYTVFFRNGNKRAFMTQTWVGGVFTGLTLPDHAWVLDPYYMVEGKLFTRNASSHPDISSYGTSNRIDHTRLQVGQLLHVENAKIGATIYGSVAYVEDNPENGHIHAVFDTHPNKCKGWSGLPIEDERGFAVGIYSYHYGNSTLAHISMSEISPITTTSSQILGRLREGYVYEHVARLGSGKSTTMPAELAKSTQTDVVVLQPFRATCMGLFNYLKNDPKF
eukprot:Lankesteria_metandrocarpae@DN6213_c0_g1_i1.p1